MGDVLPNPELGATQGGSHADEDHACRGGGIVLGGRGDVRAGPGGAVRLAVRRAGRGRGDQRDREDGMLALWLARLGLVPVRLRRAPGLRFLWRRLARPWLRLAPRLAPLVIARRARREAEHHRTSGHRAARRVETRTESR